MKTKKLNSSLNLSKNFKKMSHMAKKLGFRNVMEAIDAGYEDQLKTAYYA